MFIAVFLVGRRMLFVVCFVMCVLVGCCLLLLRLLLLLFLGLLLAAGRWLSGVESLLLVVVCWSLVGRGLCACWLAVVFCWVDVLIVSCGLFVLACWLLVVGCVLAVRCWMLVVVVAAAGLAVVGAKAEVALTSMVVVLDVALLGLRVLVLAVHCVVVDSADTADASCCVAALGVDAAPVATDPPLAALVLV